MPKGLNNTKPDDKSIFCRTPSNISASASSIITGNVRLVKNDTRGLFSSFSNSIKILFRGFMTLILLSLNLLNNWL